MIEAKQELGMTQVPVRALGRMHDRIAEMDAALRTIMRMADKAKEPCGMDPESPAAIRNGKFASIAQVAAQGLGLVSGPDLRATGEPVSAKSDKTREAFEAWAKENGQEDFAFFPGWEQYRSLATEAQWSGWQACAASHAQEVKRLREALEDMTEWVSAFAYGKSENAYAEVMRSPRMVKARAALQGDK